MTANDPTQESTMMTVSDLNRRIKQAIQRGVPGPFWLAGELTDVKIHNSGHLYFGLKDNRSVVSGAFFHGAATARQLELVNGMAVEVFGRADVYEPQGRYQIIIEQIRPAGVGDLQRRFLELKQKLEAEGLFAPERKKPIPALPKCIGVITSESGAALRDFLNIINRRFPNVHLRIINSRMQGAESTKQVRQALRYFNRHKACDVIVITRGGGSMEDMWCFNEEDLVRDVAASEIPVISAIGHEIDFTLCDFAADRREPTPSAAAEVVIGAHAELSDRLANLSRRLLSAVTNRQHQLNHRLQRASLGLQHGIQQRLDYAAKRIELCKHSYPMARPETMLLPFRQRLDMAGEAMNDAMDAGILSRDHRLKLLTGRLAAVSPEQQTGRARAELAHVGDRLEKAMARQLERKSERVKRLASQVRALDPTGVLARGYSILLDESQKAVKSHADVAVGTTLRAVLHDGSLDATVTGAKEK